MIESYKPKFNYKKYKISRFDDIRFYQISDTVCVPSVTSILNFTNPTYSHSTYLMSNSKPITPGNVNSIEIGNLLHKYLNH